MSQFAKDAMTNIYMGVVSPKSEENGILTYKEIQSKKPTYYFSKPL